MIESENFEDFVVLAGVEARVTPDEGEEFYFGEGPLGEGLNGLSKPVDGVGAVSGFDEEEEAAGIDGPSFPAGIDLNGEVAELFMDLFRDPLEL
jgi:hypothetical protein